VLGHLPPDGASPAGARRRVKAVLHAEYALSTGELCDTSRRLRLGSTRKRPALEAWLRTC
jgi:hypothetical protein